MHLKTTLALFSLFSATLISGGLSAHDIVGLHIHFDEKKLLTAITIEEKPGFYYNGYGNFYNIYGEKFLQVNSNTSKSGYTHYLSMRGKATQSGPSAIKTEIKDSRFIRARVTFSGYDTVNKKEFRCNVKVDSNVYETALHAAVNFKDGAYLTVFRRKPDDTPGDLAGYEYEKDECFFVHLSYNDDYKTFTYVNIPVGGIPLDRVRPPAEGVTLP